MSISKDRMRRLEDGADARLASLCRECGLRPPKVYVYYPDEEAYSPPEPEHCPECGSLIELITLKVEYEEERALGGRGIAIE
jgi:hypothetical protein